MEQSRRARKSVHVSELKPGQIHVDVFLQSESGSREVSQSEGKGSHQIIPGLQQIIELFSKLVLPPVFDPFLEKFQDHLGHVLGEEFARDVVNTVPQDAARKLEATLTTNLAAMLPDGVVAAVLDGSAQRIAEIVDREASPRLEQDLVQMSTNAIATRVSDLLSKRLPHTLGLELERGLAPALSRSLTKSLSVSLASTLAAAMRSQLRTESTGDSIGHLSGVGVTSGAGVLRLGPFTHECTACLGSGTDPAKAGPPGTEHTPVQPFDLLAGRRRACATCSLQEQQVLGWLYGRYFGAYFAAYYADYYTAALEAADMRQHPREGTQSGGGGGGQVSEWERTGPGSLRPQSAAGTTVDFG